MAAAATAQGLVLFSTIMHSGRAGRLCAAGCGAALLDFCICRAVEQSVLLLRPPGHGPWVTLHQALMMV